MDEKLKKLVTKLLDNWKALDKKKKIILIASAAAIVIVITVIVAAINTPKYELLYSGGLTDSEAGQIYSAVEAQGVQAKVSGTSIYVKQGTADTARMQLAEEGLPQGNLPYDVYSSGTAWADTDKDKQIKQMQQIQNRLQDAIVTISGVKRAIVTIAESNDDSYVLDSDKQPATASVMISMDNGYSLSKKQVQAIVQMVAHSVTGLSADDVSVTDEDGTPLTDSDTGTDTTTDQFNVQTKYESTMKAKLLSMLEKVYGEGNVDVAVNANIDFSSKVTNTETHSSGAPSTVTKSSAITTSGSSAASGTAGVNGAQATYPNTSSQSGTVVSSQASESTTYANDTVQQQIKENGGRLQDVTVAVMLNAHTQAAAATDTASLKQMVASAVGTKVTNVSVNQIGFSSASSSASNPGFSIFNAGSTVLYIIGASVLLLIILLSLLLVFLKRIKKKRMEKQQAALLAKMQEEEALAAQQDKKKPVTPVKSIEETLKESETNSMKAQIEEFADKKPELVAQLLKNWLKD